MSRQNRVREDGEVLLLDFEHVTGDCTCSGKRCPHCKQRKCLGAFGINRIQKDGLHPYCRACRALLSRKPRVELHVEVHVTANCACRGKRCPICQQVKCDGEFYPSKQRKRGLLAYCRTCHSLKAKERKQSPTYKAQQRAYQNFYRKAHADKVRARRKEHRRRHRQQLHAYDKFYRATHADQIKRRFNGWYRDHREYFRERRRLFRQRHPEKGRVWSRIYYQTHREAHREQERAWRRKYPERKVAREARRRARKVQAGGSFTAQQWIALKTTYHFTCLCCGRQEPQIKLTADHVIPIAKGGSNTITNIQPLCGPCNSRKNTRIIDYRPSQALS